MIYDITLTVVDSSTSTTHAGAAISIQAEKVVGQVNTGGGAGITDGDKGDVTVSAGGTVWTVDGRAITAGKMFEVGATKLLGRHTGTAGDVQEIGVHGGLEFHGGNLRTSALTGDVTASAGSGVTTIATGAVTTAKMGGDVTTAGKALLDDADAAAQRATLGLGTAATSNTSAFEASGSIATHAAVTSGVHGISTFAATFLDDADAAAVRTTLGITTGIGGTTGSTDNALLRADGTGGATAQSSNVTISDTGVITSTFYEISTATFSSRAFTQFKGLGTNVSVQVCPTGTGCFTIQLPDGTNTGGNARGDNSVDFSYSRTAATRVASGTGSFNGGTESTASGANSFSFNGNATGSRSIAIGGAAANATATSAIALGPSMTASAQSAFAAGGEGNTASAVYSSAIGGFGNNASGSFAFAFGYYAAASLYGMQAYGSGRFAATGDAQVATMVARNTTSNATPTNLFLDGSSARVVVPANSSGVAMITVVARTNTAGDNHMTWRRRVNWERGVAVGTVSIDVETVGTDRGYTGGAWGAGPAWALSITADTTNGAINIIGTGAAATNIRWVASIEWVETTFA